MGVALLSRLPSTRVLAALAAATVLAVVALLGAFASPASAWYCSPTGAQPWQHYDHGHSDGIWHDYIDGHTHSWGEHHHIWDVYQYGYFVAQVHYNCGPA